MGRERRQTCGIQELPNWIKCICKGWVLVGLEAQSISVVQRTVCKHYDTKEFLVRVLSRALLLSRVSAKLRARARVADTDQ